MSKKPSIRLMLSRDLKQPRARPPVHKPSYSMSSLSGLGKSTIDASFLNSSMVTVDEDCQNEEYPSKVPDRLPLINRSKRSMVDTDLGLRPVILKRHTPNFARSVKDLRLGLSKTKHRFAGLMPLGGLRKLEDILPIQRWRKTPPIGITILPAAPDSGKEDSPQESNNLLLISPSESPLPPVRRPSKLKELPKLGQSFDQSSLASPASSLDLSSRVTPFEDLFEKDSDTKGAYPYLPSEPRKSRNSKILLSSQLPTPQHTKRKEEKTGRSQCTCSVKLYLTASLHYQQLFLRAAPSGASVQHLPSLVLLSMSKSELERKALVVTILFEGVIGDWSKRCLTDNSAFFLKIRKEAVAGLEMLQRSFRLVLISRMPKKLCINVLTYFRNRNINFEACYRITSHVNTPESRYFQFLCYSKIEKDLEIEDPTRRMLVITSLNLPQEELEQPSADLLYSKRGTRYSLNADFLPISVPAPDGVPVTCLVPGMQSQESSEILSFTHIAKTVLGFWTRCRDDWVSGFYSEAEPSELYLFSTSAVHQVLMAHVLPEPRADAYLCQILPSHTCTLHNRLAWGMGPSIHPFTSKLILITAQSKPDIQPGFDILETRPQSLRSGFANLLHYVCAAGRRPANNDFNNLGLIYVLVDVYSMELQGLNLPLKSVWLLLLE